ncbi:MAG: hypothetical protein AB1531_06250 [Chloroflexota bacterium]
MNKFLRFILLAILFAFSLTAGPLPAFAAVPGTGAQASGVALSVSKRPAADGDLPSLSTFIGQVRNSQANLVTGLYITDLFAYPVVQQPSGQPAYVSKTDDTITQFGLATAYGSLGFLAHNTLAGAQFSSIKVGQLIAVVYGDGHYTLYEVSQVRRFQATRPASPYSSFVDLSTNATLTASDLFYQTYGVKNTLVLQTCITSNGLDTWGRLFIIATPHVFEMDGDL